MKSLLSLLLLTSACAANAPSIDPVTRVQQIALAEHSYLKRQRDADRLYEAEMRQVEFCYTYKPNRAECDMQSVQAKTKYEHYLQRIEELFQQYVQAL